MITLFIDTHSSFAIMALYKDEKLWLKKEMDGQQNHSSICMPSLVSLLEEAQINLDDISDIVVVIGPGSFTGVRLGVTIAKTIAYTKNIPIRTLTSLELFLNSSLTCLYMAMPEKNGFFVGKLNEQKDAFVEYFYLSKLEFEDFKNDHSVCGDNSINYDSIISYAHMKESINPHAVNPFYVKKIEVEK